MQTLIWVLVLGGVLYFIMRIGRGAQMSHGGGGSSHAGGCCGGHAHDTQAHDTHAAHEEARESLAGQKDPVCGMYVTTDGAHSLTHDGTNYYFCSEACKAKFEASPDRYVKTTDHA